MSAIFSYSASNIPLTAQKQEFLSKQSTIHLQKTKTPPSLLLSDYVLGRPIKHPSVNTSPARITCFSLVLLAHLAVVYMVKHTQPESELVKPATPITVSMIAPPSLEVKPEPEVVPIVEPVKVLKKSVIKPKKVVEKIVSVESPTQPVFEASTEPLEDKSEPVEQVAAPVVIAKATPKAQQEEEKMELPKYGVAYLNNPAPEYPSMARRAGEDGRVLLKVLVSAEGAAEAVSLEKSSGSDRLDSAAKDAVSRWRFVPARKGGQALSAYVIVPIKFSLDD